jgi:hypothetical protein
MKWLAPAAELWFRMSLKVPIKSNTERMYKEADMLIGHQ